MGRAGKIPKSKRCYCAFCKSPRVMYRKRHISWFDFIQSAFAAGLISLVFWQDFDPRALVVFALFCGLSEVFIVLRWRLSVACPHCGFDPVLYKRAPEKAADRVNKHMHSRRQNPMSAFIAPPRLPRLKRKIPVPESPLYSKNSENSKNSKSSRSSAGSKLPAPEKFQSNSAVKPPPEAMR